MTAPGPDLDALENTVDAMRQAGVSGVTLSVDEADALIAAARERDALLRELATAMGQNERYRRALSAAKADIGTVAITGSRAKAETARVRIDAALAPEQEAQHGE